MRYHASCARRPNPREGTRNGAGKLATFPAKFLLGIAVAATFVTSSNAQTVKADFDSGVIAPLVNLGDPLTSTTTSLFGGVVNLALDAGGGSTGLGDGVSVQQDLVASVDFLDWDESLDQTLSIATIAQGSGSASNGYSLRIDLATEQFDIVRIVGNTLTVIANTPVALDPLATDYRMVLMRNGSVLTGQLLDLKGASNPAVEISVDDAGGLPGFVDGATSVVLAEKPASQTGGDVTIDNFLAAPAAASAASDSDGDLLADLDDSCPFVSNGPNQLSNQVDSDGDGCGNACDGDFDNNGIVQVSDIAIFLGEEETLLDGANLQLDLDGDRAATLADLATVWHFVVDLVAHCP